MRRVAVLQSNYIPWRGYFDLIASVDEFVLYDDAQYTRRDWRNRNMIKTPQGKAWLTVPVRAKGRFEQSVRKTEIDGSEWQATHWKSILQHYARAPHLGELRRVLGPVYEGPPHAMLSSLNRALIEAVCGYLRIGTVISSSEGCSLPRSARQSWSRSAAAPVQRPTSAGPRPAPTSTRASSGPRGCGSSGSVTRDTPTTRSSGAPSTRMSRWWT